MQERDQQNRLLNLVFMRSQQQASLREKRDNFQKMQQFKQGISHEQIQVLKDRQFVIVDQAQLMGRNKKLQKKKEERKSQSANSGIDSDHKSTNSKDNSKADRDSLEENTQNRGSTIDSLEVDDEEAQQRHQLRIEREIKELKDVLAAKSETVLWKNALKNSEFNRDMRRKFNKFKRQARDRLMFEEE